MPTSVLRRNLQLGDQSFCYYIPASQSEKTGFSPVIVVEGESGYYQTDYNWGNVREYADQACKQLNERLGLTEDRTMQIITSSMAVKERGRR